MEWRRKILRRWPVQASLLGAALLIASVPAVGAKPPAKPSKPAPKSTAKGADSKAAKAGAQDAKKKKDPASAAKGATQPPEEGKLLTDEQGQQYHVEKLAKAGLRFMRLDENTVRTSWGIPIEVVKEDDEYFYYKVYKTDPDAQAQTSLRHVVSPEEKQKVLAGYEVKTPTGKNLTFAPFSTGLPTSGQWRNGFDVADMNGDGHLDIAHGPARKSLTNPTIFLGDGKGTWRRWSEAKYPRLPFDYGDAAAADFNGDGVMDLALGMHLRGLVAMIGDGKGNFADWGKGLDLQVPGPKNDGGGFSSRTIATLDWNQDGRPDILALGEGPRLATSRGRQEGSPSMVSRESFGVVVYLNQGNGVWERKDQGTSSRELFGDALAVGDFNGDRRMDFATGSNSMGSRNLVSYARQDLAWETTEVDLARPRSYHRSVTAADFNGDGLADLALGYLSFELDTWRSGIDLLLAQPDGTWTRRPVAVREGRTEVSALDHGDLDGDGHLDLVGLTGEGEGETWVFRGDGKGGFTREEATGIPAFVGGCRGYHVELADLDRDGKDEIVSAFAGESSALFAPDRCTSGGGLQAWRLVSDGKR